jgi:RNA-binding protein
MPTTITEAERRALKRLAHHLEVVVRTGSAGLTDAVIAEAGRALAHHELMKVRVLAGEREDRDAMIRQLCETLGAALVQRVGHVATLYRPRDKDSRIGALIKAKK